MYCFTTSKVYQAFILKRMGLQCRLLKHDSFCLLSESINSQFRFSSINKQGPEPSQELKELDLALKKRIFNTVLWESEEEVNPWKKLLRDRSNYHRELRKSVLEGIESSRPVILKLLENHGDLGHDNKESSHTEDNPPMYPYAKAAKTRDKPKNFEDILQRRISKQADEGSKENKERLRHWMSDYDLYDEKSTIDNDAGSSLNYGSSDPNEPVSKVPCGGCGALLHCQDHSIPGYLPKQLFSRRRIQELKSMICQRCHFLKEFNIALDVSVTPEEYPNIISCIKDKRAIAVIIIDLLDFPCSIWPDIMNIIGTARPVIIVGNKVDLIPGDHMGYLNHLQETLQMYVEKMGIAKANIKHVALISAKTGFGVEDLITQLHTLWDFKSDIFLLGCTNVGKSTLFNMLLQSDFCKTQAVDLVQRATTSIWPGTTLNLLKFPVLRPEGWRLALRNKRLVSEAHRRKEEKALRKEQLQKYQRMFHLPSLVQYVGRTFLPKPDDNLLNKTKDDLIGIDDESYDFAHGRWCYDTPGVMHPDQILNLLTTEELMKVIPKRVIVPRFFTLKPGKSLFLGGLGRLDYLGASKDRSSRVAVFSSNLLPITIVETEEANDVYEKLLGSELLAVPCGGPKRLNDWPGLKVRDEIIKVKGLGWKECCADLILSSAGWVSVSGGTEMEMSFRVWTPHCRGIHLRQPALLPYAVNYRGKRIHHTPTYYAGRADGQMDKTESNTADQYEEGFS